MLTNIIKLILRPFLGVPVPFFPRNKSLCSPVPQNQNLVFYVLCSPKLPLFPFPSFLYICYLVPLKYMPLFPCSLKPLGGPQYSMWQFYTIEPYSSNACEIRQLKITQNARLSQCIHNQSCFKNAISRATSCCTCRFQSAKVLLYWTQKKKVQHNSLYGA